MSRVAVPIPFSDVQTEAVNETPEATQYNRACQRVSHNALFWKSQTNSVNDSIYDFVGVFLEIPVKLHCGNVVDMPYLTRTTCIIR